jgi:hypothetical protein
MDISKVKYFIYRSLSLDDKDTIHICKSIDDILRIDNWSKRCVGTFGIVETEHGDIAFEIELTYSGEPYVWKKFMHIESFLKFHPYAKIHCHDKSSHTYMIKLTDQFKDYGWEISQKFYIIDNENKTIKII